MRYDMDKVLVEKARRGGNKFRSKTVGAWRHSKKMEEFVGEGTHAKSTSKIVGWERKELNENLNPLKRFLHSRVGKKWDDVYSEICSRIDKKNAVQGHIIQHLFQYVEIDHRYQNGYAFMYWSRKKDDYVPDFYVDANGILCLGKDYHYISWRRAYKEREAAKEKTAWAIGDIEIHKINGTWFTVDYRKATEKDFHHRIFYNNEGEIIGERFDPQVKDVITDGYPIIGQWYRWRKLPASSEVLKKFGVKND